MLVKAAKQILCFLEALLSATSMFQAAAVPSLWSPNQWHTLAVKTTHCISSLTHW